jgi:hypothetical protein
MSSLPAHEIENDHRLTTRLLSYWRQVRGVNTMPQESDIDPDDLGADWDSCFLLQARDVEHMEDYNFTYLGADIIRAYRGSVLDEQNHYMVGPQASRLSGIFHRVLLTGAPVYDEGEFVTAQGARILYRQCALPLGGPDKGVEAIFGGMHYKVLD